MAQALTQNQGERATLESLDVELHNVFKFFNQDLALNGVY
ncbi:MAG: spermidine/putrescine ABC transporter ATP-binding protein, partial [Brasilonema sp.]